ncbi:MAG: hypothetical protein K6B14_05635 [Lachnospiraceae bacterium]|nr:hypothetical protein [Lachnospiraceae bacterium]
MKKVMIAAMESGCGKTIFTCGLIRTVMDLGYEVSSFKCGPDYIDPMYLKAAAGRPCRNLDVFLQKEAGVKKTFEKSEGFAVVEAAMGYYDGLGGSDEASAYHVARLLDIPVILLVRPGKNSVTLAAQIKGLLSFREDNGIRAVVLTGCRRERYESLKPVIEDECGIKVAGYLSRMEEAVLPSRHLGLVTADEMNELEQRFEVIKKAMEENVDVHYICSL